MAVRIADRQAELDLRRDQYQHSREVEQPLNEEISRTESDLGVLKYRRDQALSAVFSASPEYLALYQRQAELWTELRSLHLCMQAVNGAGGGGRLDRRLRDLAEVS